MPDFTLPAYQGGTVTLSALRGKNVMIIFPRGYAAENYWCTICNYKYAELVEVLIVLPYSPDVVKAWVDVLPEQLDKVKERKHPADPAKLDDKGKQTMERYRGQEAVKGSRAFHDGMGPEHRGPAGIRLSVQGPGGLERDEVNARANVCVLLHSWPPRGVAPFHPAMTISRQVCSEDPDARFACRGFIIIAHTCIGFL